VARTVHCNSTLLVDSVGNLKPGVHRVLMGSRFVGQLRGTVYKIFAKIRQGIGRRSGQLLRLMEQPCRLAQLFRLGMELNQADSTGTAFQFQGAELLRARWIPYLLVPTGQLSWSAGLPKSLFKYEQGDFLKRTASRCIQVPAAGRSEPAGQDLAIGSLPDNSSAKRWLTSEWAGFKPASAFQFTFGGVQHPNFPNPQKSSIWGRTTACWDSSEKSTGPLFAFGPTRQKRARSPRRQNS